MQYSPLLMRSLQLLDMAATGPQSRYADDSDVDDSCSKGVQRRIDPFCHPWQQEYHNLAQ